MKRPQRDFVVEIKSSRRIPKSKSSSIWGSLDLKAHAAEIENELREHENGAAIQNLAQIPSEIDNANPDWLPKSEVMPRGEGISDESSEIADTAVPSTQDPMKVDEVPKTRAEMTSPVPKVKGRQRVAGGSQTARPKATAPDNVASLELKPVGRRKRAPRKTPGTASDDAKTWYELDKDLAELETENKRLRKLLADKLHNENAELKRKLGIL